MATNENEIGITAKVSGLDKFESDLAAMDKALTRTEKDIENIAKRREAAARQVQQAEERTLQRQESALKKHTVNLRTVALAITGVVASAVIAYKQLEQAAKDLGDAQAIAEFEAMDKTMSAFKDTVAAVGLEILKATGAIPGITSGITALGQVVTVVGAGLAGFIEIVKGIDFAGANERAKASARFQGVTTGPAISPDTIKKATEAYRNAIQAAVNAPAARESTVRATEQEKQLADRFKAQEQYAEKFRDLQIKTGQSLLNAEREYQQSSASAWQDYIEKTNSIVAEGVKARAKIQQDYQNKISDAEREYQRGTENLNASHGQRMADIERDYQKRIAEIQGQYKVDALDAIRNLDAIALIRAKERRDKDLAGARTGRDEQIAQEQNDYQNSLNELIRALSDKRREAEDDRRRELDEQRRGEQEKQQEAKDSYNKQMSEAQQAFNDKIAAIRGQYRQEDVEAQAHYLNQEAQLRNHLIAMQNIMRTYGLSGGGTVTSPTRRAGGGYRRAEGGVDVVTQPTQFTAGEAGPELAIFAPLNRALPSPIMQTINHVGDFSHSVDAAITSSVAGLDGRIMAAVRKALGEVIR